LKNENEKLNDNHNAVLNKTISNKNIEIKDIPNKNQNISNKSNKQLEEIKVLKSENEKLNDNHNAVLNKTISNKNIEIKDIPNKNNNLINKKNIINELPDKTIYLENNNENQYKDNIAVLEKEILNKDTNINNLSNLNK